MINARADWKEPIPAPAVQVVKIGGSVLKGCQDYFRAAKFVRQRLQSGASERLVVVVSARWGETDELLQAARKLSRKPDPRALDLLFSCGETRSVALLALCLQGLGIPAVGLNAHQTGLALRQGASNGDWPTGLQSRPKGLLERLKRYRALIVPGFFATTSDHTLISLGRGGSDLTALLIADALKASRCDLIKDVGGYFDRDPKRFHDARPVAALSYRQALEMARSGCGLVQQQALKWASQRGIPLLVRGLQAPFPCTLVGGASGIRDRNPDFPFQPEAWSLKPGISSTGSSRNEICD